MNKLHNILLCHSSAMYLCVLERDSNSLLSYHEWNRTEALNGWTRHSSPSVCRKQALSTVLTTWRAQRSSVCYIFIALHTLANYTRTSRSVLIIVKLSYIKIKMGMAINNLPQVSINIIFLCIFSNENRRSWYYFKPGRSIGKQPHKRQ